MQGLPGLCDPHCREPMGSPNPELYPITSTSCYESTHSDLHLECTTTRDVRLFREISGCRSPGPFRSLLVYLVWPSARIQLPRLRVSVLQHY